VHAHGPIPEHVARLFGKTLTDEVSLADTTVVVRAQGAVGDTTGDAHPPQLPAGLIDVSVLAGQPLPVALATSPPSPALHMRGRMEFDVGGVDVKIVGGRPALYEFPSNAGTYAGVQSVQTRTSVILRGLPGGDDFRHALTFAGSVHTDPNTPVPFELGFGTLPGPDDTVELTAIHIPAGTTIDEPELPKPGTPIEHFEVFYDAHGTTKGGPIPTFLGTPEPPQDTKARFTASTETCPATRTRYA
jgi:hypothetical protein